jgi:hypothetical protein
MEDGLIDNAFLTMMLELQLLQESQPEEVPDKPRQSGNISREEGHRIATTVIESKLLFE